MPGVMIIDDHPVIQMGMSSLVKRYNLYREVEIAEDGMSAVRKLKKLQATGQQNEESGYDLLVVDVNLPDIEILALMEIIKSICPDTPVMIFTTSLSETYVRRLIKLGVQAYVHKSASDDELVRAVNLIKRGKKYFSDKIMETVADGSLADTDPDERFTNLSSREFEIMHLLVQGKTVGSIGKIVNLHKSSVATYKARIFKKLGVDNVVDLYQIAVRHKLVSPKF